MCLWNAFKSFVGCSNLEINWFWLDTLSSTRNVHHLPGMVEHALTLKYWNVMIHTPSNLSIIKTCSGSYTINLTQYFWFYDSRTDMANINLVGVLQSYVIAHRTRYFVFPSLLPSVDKLAMTQFGRILLLQLH